MMLMTMMMSPGSGGQCARWSRRGGTSSDSPLRTGNDSISGFVMILFPVMLSSHQTKMVSLTLRAGHCKLLKLWIECEVKVMR